MNQPHALSARDKIKRFPIVAHRKSLVVLN